MSEANSSAALLRWLRGKLSEAEKSLRCREEMANPTPISEEDLERLKSMPGVRVTKGRKLSKAEVKEMEMAPLRHGRIAEKCRHEVEMFKAVISAIDQYDENGVHNEYHRGRQHERSDHLNAKAERPL